MSSLHLGILMDPIDHIKPFKDSTLAMMLAARRRGWELHYMEGRDLRLEAGRTWARTRTLEVFDDADRWFLPGPEEDLPLDRLDLVLMRKDPPFDLEYLYLTHLLESAEGRGLAVFNPPAALRDANEKLFALRWPELTPPNLVTCDLTRIKAFLSQQGDIVLKPLDAMGGASVFRITASDPNLTVIWETLTQHGRRLVLAQRFLPEVLEGGDRRILLIDGEPVPYALARMPPPGEIRANLAVGGRGHGVELSDRDLAIAERIGPELRRRGIVFAGIDVIGGYLTEVNVTSPTCIRELDRAYGLDIAGRLLDCIERRLAP